MLAEATAEEFEARQRRDVDPFVEPTAVQVRALFRAQANRFLELLRPIYEPAETAESFAVERTERNEWLSLLDEAIESTEDAWQAIRDEIDVLFTLGAVANSELLEVTISFDLENPRAVAYLRDTLDKRIRDIDERTKDIIDKLVSESVENGDSFTTLANKVRAVAGFDNELFGVDVKWEG